MKQPLPLELKQEIKLHINQCLFDQGLIPGTIYEAAKQEILKSTTAPAHKKENRQQTADGRFEKNS